MQANENLGTIEPGTWVKIDRGDLEGKKGMIMDNQSANDKSCLVGHIEGQEGHINEMVLKSDLTPLTKAPPIYYKYWEL